MSAYSKGKGQASFDIEYLYPKWWQIGPTLLLSSKMKSHVGFRLAYLVICKVMVKVMHNLTGISRKWWHVVQTLLLTPNIKSEDACELSAYSDLTLTYFKDQGQSHFDRTSLKWWKVRSCHARAWMQPQGLRLWVAGGREVFGAGLMSGLSHDLIGTRTREEFIFIIRERRTSSA